MFFKGQLLTDEQHLNLASLYGNPCTFPPTKYLGVENPLTYIKDDKESPPKADGWHTDITWIQEPPKMGFLQAIEMPESGGDTMWGCTYAAYDALSPQMAGFFESLTINHFIGDNILREFEKRGGLEMRLKLSGAFPAVSQPLIRTHPDTGRKALFYGGGFMQSVEGMEDSESESLLNFLHEHVNNPNFHVRWEWEAGDLAIWDERCTIHRGLAYHFPQNRIVRRCTVDGDKPFFKP